jgi:hypothetical protein
MNPYSKSNTTTPNPYGDVPLEEFAGTNGNYYPEASAFPRTDIIAGEMAFKKTLYGKELDSDEKVKYNLLLTWVKNNPNYVPQILKDTEYIVLQQKTSNLRRGDNSEVLFSGEETNKVPISPFRRIR